ncbi:bifunctional helix-turn-helix transcriptional regulator/GNAT family N-acetyltransferase [Rhizobium tubonense]|nr:helix-turn-helix domain-containing GNAT family N-acetyltransferase [Rhizobium tubonense]
MTDSAPDTIIAPLRDASRRLVRELGFMNSTLAGTNLPPSAVHALIEIGRRGTLTAAELCNVLNLEKSSVSRMTRKLIASGDLSEGASDQDGRAKPLSLTPKGWSALAAIDIFARNQVSGALEKLTPERQGRALEGLEAYSRALEARRTGGEPDASSAISIERGYRPGVIGRSVEMHARYYARTASFGHFFESKVAAGLAEFVGRLDRPHNEIWAALEAGNIIGTIAIDGEDLGTGIAHLRWFIVEDGRRASGTGTRLLNQAVAFCDRNGFEEIQLWTFKGLDAARRLYEASGFVLAEEQPGRQWGKEVTEQRFVRKVEGQDDRQIASRQQS